VEVFVTSLQLLGGGRAQGQAAAEPSTGEMPQAAPGSPGTSPDDFNDDIPF
jgi:hypothetical protein